MKLLAAYLAVLLSATVLLLSPGQAQAAENVNNFRISTYNIAYQLGRGSESVATLKTTETITVDFSAASKNHGIERAIPNSFDGHTTNLSITSVTNLQNQPQPYTTRQDTGNTIVRIGNSDRYVTDRRTYVIRYEQRHVTKFFADTKAQEFYWDTNGTDWKVPIDSLTINLAIDPALTSALNGRKACYQGTTGATNACKLTTHDTYAVGASSLEPGDNITIAIGFNPGTFAHYQPTTFEQLVALWQKTLILGAVIGSLVTVYAIVRWYRRSERTSEIHTIIPEYLPPKDASVTTSAAIMNADMKAFSAQLIDFAVRHYIKIYQTSKKSFWKNAEYEIEVIKDTQSLLDEEREILLDIFGFQPQPGDRLALKKLKNNQAVSSRMTDNTRKLRDLIRGRYTLRARNPVEQKWFTKTAIILLIIAIISLNPFLLTAALVAFVLSRTLHPLTDKGLALRCYLLGLKEYIRVAEADRLAMLQSPEGAAKVGSIDANSPQQLIKLYEQVLPYAILFGQEKDWNKQLGRYYESTQTNPDWYHSHAGAFTAGAFAGSMQSFSSAVMYSSPSNASSGGSGGGGFSGGGGGGGGGGGW